MESNYSHGNTTSQLEETALFLHWDIKSIEDVHCPGEGCQGLALHLTPAFAPSPQPCPIPPPGPRAALGPSGRALSAPPPPSPLGLPVLSIYTHGPGPLQAGPADGETTRPVSAEVPPARGRRLLPAPSGDGAGTVLLTHTPASRRARPPLSRGWGGPYRAAYALCARYASTYGICATGALSGAAPALTTLRRIRKKH